MSARLLFLHCLSPLHAGTGQSIGAVDLPIAREVSTALPFLPGPSIKGCLRDASRYTHDTGTTIGVFGPDTANASDHAGALTFGDGRIVCFPVRSVYGTFAWATSPLLLQRLARDASEADVTFPKDGRDLVIPAINEALVTRDSRLVKGGKVLFEDLDFTARAEKNVDRVAEWLASLLFDNDAERGAFTSRFIVLHDDAMSYLTRHAVDIVTRASIDPDTKTVKRGQLWTEENLPTETILVSLVAEVHVLARRAATHPFDSLNQLCKHTVQFGGHATIGRGRCALRLVKGGG